MNSEIPVGTIVLLSKNSDWHHRNAGPWNPVDTFGLLGRDDDNDIAVEWFSYGHECIYYDDSDDDLIPVFGTFSREQMRMFARNNDELTVVDCGREEQYRWQLAVKEI